MGLWFRITLREESSEEVNSFSYYRTQAEAFDEGESDDEIDVVSIDGSQSQRNLSYYRALAEAFDEGESEDDINDVLSGPTTSEILVSSNNSSVVAQHSSGSPMTRHRMGMTKIITSVVVPEPLQVPVQVPLRHKPKQAEKRLSANVLGNMNKRRSYTASGIQMVVEVVWHQHRSTEFLQNFTIVELWHYFWRKKKMESTRGAVWLGPVRREYSTSNTVFGVIV